MLSIVTINAVDFPWYFLRLSNFCNVMVRWAAILLEEYTTTPPALAVSL
jgi:hypothetical protein